ncbi:hypothetical protein HETIRDRAFT_327358 [Heterobasidion irregulare TC 32-1]|uniref:Uncharacterized protein n=1 Tax=Heterobasidion irregulare (strain TC 32-1) TaxID=747525 RepID=W4JVF9_HETIT|nr:uncharacterized protein HETIRDRAFT_327358 [Heterobasidion irregulare TC 32-1]ETW77065.1 hypothetical protein HETIRDRAFT_327358 [Heterobasidion irregulare TC 32-1]
MAPWEEETLKSNIHVEVSFQKGPDLLSPYLLPNLLFVAVRVDVGWLGAALQPLLERVVLCDVIDTPDQATGGAFDHFVR